VTGNHILIQAVVVGAAWAALLAAAPRLWPTPRLRRLPDEPDTPPARTLVMGIQPRPAPRTSWVTALGSAIRRHTIQRLAATPAASFHPAPTSGAARSTDRPAPPPVHRRATIPDIPARGPDERADGRTGWAALASVGLLPVAPALAPIPLACTLAAPLLNARSAHRRHAAALVDQLPDVVDLLSLTTAAGLPVTAALTAIADRPGGPLGTAMGRAAAHLRAGGPLAGALTHLATVGPQARPLVDALAHHERYGSPLLPALGRVAIEARSRRRRLAEETARRLPVTLLFPLLLTTFPAFVALTVVPLLAGSLGALSL
jgi:tight adherence protein C